MLYQNSSKHRNKVRGVEAALSRTRDTCVELIANYTVIITRGVVIYGAPTTI